jgi:hypothetical protein
MVFSVIVKEAGKYDLYKLTALFRLMRLILVSIMELNSLSV